MSEVYIGRHFLKDDCYSKQIISALAKESLIPYNLTLKRPRPFILWHKMSPQTKSNKCKIKLIFLTAVFAPNKHKELKYVWTSL